MDRKTFIDASKIIAFEKKVNEASNTLSRISNGGNTETEIKFIQMVDDRMTVEYSISSDVLCSVDVMKISNFINDILLSKSKANKDLFDELKSKKTDTDWIAIDVAGIEKELNSNQ